VDQFYLMIAVEKYL